MVTGASFPRASGRANGHLKRYDPQKAPVTKDLPHIETAALDYYDKYWKVFWHRLYDKHGLSSPHSRSLFNGKDLSGWSMERARPRQEAAGQEAFRFSRWDAGPVWVRRAGIF